ncbi:unnamed protein product, partial [Cyprideis torosa]
MAPYQERQEAMFLELKSRIKEDDSSVPYFLNEYWYLQRYEVGKEYPIYSRKHKNLEAKEEILFDVNQMAEGHAYYQLGGIAVSPNNALASFGVDTCLYAKGGSAGGLLMGAVMNMAPELFHGMISNVPFVDVVTTMLDDSIPLTT